MSQIYYILNHEVTVGEYRLCMEAGACRYSEPTESRHWTMKNPDRVDAPLNYISWDQAQEYTRWLSRQYPGDYRLCSEAEWEYAARAEGQGRFGCGTEVKCLNQHAWHSRNLSQPGPQPVQRKQPNTWGLFDMQEIFGNGFKTIMRPSTRNSHPTEWSQRGDIANSSRWELSKSTRIS